MPTVGKFSKSISKPACAGAMMRQANSQRLGNRSRDGVAAHTVVD